MAVYNLRWIKTARYVEDPANEDVDIREGFYNAHWQLISDDQNWVSYRSGCRSVWDVPKEDRIIKDVVMYDPDSKLVRFNRD